MTAYRDGFGNWCTRIVAPAGRLRLTANSVLNDTGEPDPIVLSERQHAVEDLPEESLVFLLGSRYCETDRLSPIAWDLFGKSPAGAGRVQAICDYVHHHIAFSYQDARSTRTAWEALAGAQRRLPRLRASGDRLLPLHEHSGSLLHRLSRATSASRRPTARWISRPGSRPTSAGRWHTFDPRNNTPRIGRVLIARGRDATDVAISNTFGPNTLAGFTVWTDEVM